MMSSLYIGATGMIALGEGMGTVSHNLSNLNTVGFKERLHLFEDLVSSSVNTPSNATGRGNVLPTSYSQQGHGSRTSAVISRFYENGALEMGDRVTDLAISGKGFFQVTGNDDKTFYTRAGNFAFTKEGELINPGGLHLMGRRLDANGNPGNLEQIKLDPQNDMYLAAKASTKATIISNLGMTESKTTNATDPYFSLALTYDANREPVMGNSGYSNGVSVYDSEGKKHDLTVNYDLVEKTSDGRKIVQYTVSIPPGEDGRAGFEGTDGAGLIMSGTMTFTSAGILQNMSAFTPTDGTNVHNLATWNSVAIGADGVPMNMTFKNTDQSGNVTRPSQTVTLDMGLGFASPAGSVQAAAIGTNPDNLPGYTGAGNTLPANVGNENRTVAYSGEVSTINRGTDGYMEGWMRGMEINPRGEMNILYDNGQSQPLYQIPLFNFMGEQDLKAEGGNLYSSTLGSGEAMEGVADEENFGKIVSTTLEMSNVDVGRQFTHMITNQRGFQFNSKVITTSDSMLQKALELKRA